MKHPNRFYTHEMHMGDYPMKCYAIPYHGRSLRVHASVWGEVEHVSVSLPNRCPNWLEMSYVKSLFWDKQDMCVQFHPREEEYVNLHNFCLHIWKLPDRINTLIDDVCKDGEL